MNLPSTGAVAAWSFDPAHWGRCGQGPTEAEAVEDLRSQCLGDSGAATVGIVERIVGDEQAFARDLAAPTPQEITSALGLLREVRAQTPRPGRRGRTRRAGPRGPPPDAARPGLVAHPRQLAWHIADTESR